ncbi:hypothetical protein NMK54_22545 [Nocardia otitidiscaviarum]|nr:hypothetical protein [Nocardia otitidiscaviarum]MCP9622933.1 hypothetical protein [Nocardia otitidiscaviarum]
MTNTRTVLRCTAATLAAAVVLTGCTDSESPGTDTTSEAVSPCADDGSGRYRPPEQVCDATVVWSAEPGIDLFSPEATLVRASIEADRIAGYAGPEVTYPGYMDAVEPRKAEFYEDATVYRGTHSGTIQVHIQQIQPTEDGFHAKFCALTNASTSLRKFGDGRTYISSYDRGVAADVRLARIGDEAAEFDAGPYEPAPDRLHWQAPTGNLFDSWQVYFPSGEDSAHRAACDAWALSLYPDAPAENENVFLDAPLPAQPAYPGWPAPPV